jgi:hypothetical protein
MFLGSNPVSKVFADIRDYGLEYVFKRYYSLYGGEVSSVEDSQLQGRTRVKVGILGIGKVNPDNEFEPDSLARRALPTSIYAGKDHGIYFPPEVGDAVWVSFDHGDPAHPRYHGSWWRTTLANGTGTGTELPVEFRPTKQVSRGEGESASVSEEPKRRGIKTAYGHGLIFSDEESEAYATLWSGKQLGEGEAATRRQRIILSDSTGTPEEEIEEGIYASTFYGHRLAMNDTGKTVKLSGKQDNLVGENSIEFDDNTDKVTIKTKGPEGLVHTVELDATEGKITIQTDNPVPQTIVLDGTTGNIDITSPAAVNVSATGALTMSATGGIAMGSGASPPAPSSPGFAVETGAGAKLIEFAGAITENIQSMTQAVTAAFIQTAATIAQTAATSITLTAPSISLLGGLIVIGDPLTARGLSNELLADFVLNHEHPLGTSGAPTGKPTPGPLGTLVTDYLGLPLPPITLADYVSAMRAT